MSDEDEKPPCFSELIGEASSLAESVSELFSKKEMLTCMVTLCLLIRSSSKAGALDAVSHGMHNMEGLPPELVMKTVLAFEGFGELASEVMTHYAACVIGGDLEGQIKEYYSNDITEEELAASKSNLSEICDSLFNPSND